MWMRGTMDGCPFPAPGRWRPPLRWQRKEDGRSGKRFAQGGKAVGDAAMRHTPSRPERSNSREWGDALTKQARSLQQGLGLANDFPL